ncbi:hypothetical protein DFA_03715 [Cavenderia fasciculata]|uniref:Uncharacterized protein n=1 Tax=Cavenderia fasciculata TaxID=261658 RepID=F4Q1S8_CACFS|nr:uncharacterized protein DFA_03715 [Cavenderia fasciculata]EGG18228.1 hypothetical protein DFA_03715 [Cavenderia fasciculata]|eukprot:XP_004357051.1 hypothetical protein DFA_03715 [Cavenderia fasciculata]
MNNWLIQKEIIDNIWLLKQEKREQWDGHNRDLNQSVVPLGDRIKVSLVCWKWCLEHLRLCISVLDQALLTRCERTLLVLPSTLRSLHILFNARVTYSSHFLHFLQGASRVESVTILSPLRQDTRIKRDIIQFASQCPTLTTLDCDQLSFKDVYQLCITTPRIRSTRLSIVNHHYRIPSSLEPTPHFPHLHTLSIDSRCKDTIGSLHYLLLPLMFHAPLLTSLHINLYTSFSTSDHNNQHFSSMITNSFVLSIIDLLKNHSNDQQQLQYLTIHCKISQGGGGESDKKKRLPSVLFSTINHLVGCIKDSSKLDYFVLSGYNCNYPIDYNHSTTTTKSSDCSINLNREIDHYNQLSFNTLTMKKKGIE